MGAVRYLQLSLAILCLSQPAPLIRLARAPNEVIGFWRMLAAAALLAPAAWSRRGSWLRLSGGQRILLCVSGVLFFAHLWSFVYSAQHTTVADCVVAFSTHPLWTAAGAWLFLGERIQPRQGLAYCLAGFGVAGLFWGAASLGPAGLRGDLAGLASAATFSGYILCGRTVRRRLDNAVFAAAASGVCAVLFLGCGAAKGSAWTGYPPSFWAAVLALAVVVSIGGHALFTHLLETFDVNVLSCAKLLEPALAAVTARVLFGEALSWRTAWAFSFVAASVLVLLLPSRGGVRLEPAELED